MSALPTTILPRLGSLVRMLSSPNDGEALGAVRAVGRTLQANGATWHDLADRIEHGAISFRADQVPSWGALTKSQRLDWLDQAERSAALSKWERGFAVSLRAQVQASRSLSDKQAAVADTILSKLHSARAAA